MGREATGPENAQSGFDRDAVTREAWRTFLRAVPRAAVGNFIGAVGFAAAVLVSVGGWFPIVWLAVLAAVNGARLVLLRRLGRRAVGRTHVRAARRQFLAATTLAGVTWGLGFAVMLPGAGFALQVLGVGFAAGLAAGAMTTLHAIWAAYLCFTLPLGLPLAATLAAQGTPHHLAAGAGVLITLLVVTLGSHRLNRRLQTLVQVQQANRRLIRDLAAERDRATASDQAKSEFLATMSHEIRTPMNGVLGMTELIAKTPLNAQQRNYVDALHKSGRVLLNLINDVLDVSKIESGKFELGNEAFNVQQLMAELEQMFAPRAEEKGIGLHVETDLSAARPFSGDAARLQQILINLIGNAIKFTDTGEVRVRALVQSRTDRASTVRFEVSDTGVGIPEAQQTRIFGAFDQADGNQPRAAGGTGLGLHIALKLVRLMDGDLGLQSTPGQGSTFAVRLTLEHADDAPTRARPVSPAQSRRVGTPLVFEQPVDDAPPTGEPTPAPGPPEPGAPRILLAEDNPVNQQVAEAMLRHLGCEVQTVANGEDAFYTIVKSPEAFSLVLMDCDMPVMDGFEATRRLRARGFDHEQLPVVALTASAMSGDRARCLAAGMSGYVAKPVSEPELEAVLAGDFKLLNAESEAMADGTREAHPKPRSGSSGAEAARPGTDTDRTATWDAGSQGAETHSAETGDAETQDVETRSNGHGGSRPIEQVLDPNTIQQLRGLQRPDGPDVFAQLAEQFITSSSQLLGRLETAIDGADSTTVRRTAHSLKSSSASVGAIRLSDHFRSLEVAGREERLREAANLMPPIRDEMARVHGALRVLRNQDTTSGPSA